MKTILCKWAVFGLLSVSAMGAALAISSQHAKAQQTLAEGGQWGQKGGKGVC